eukprot:scaffold15153_cov183-Skeletonema_menzelii.AAC.1
MFTPTLPLAYPYLQYPWYLSTRTYRGGGPTKETREAKAEGTQATSETLSTIVSRLACRAPV